MIAAIHIKFRQVRRDLSYATEGEIREERLAFINDTLRLKREVTSMRDCTDRQLGLVLDALAKLETQPTLPDSRAIVPKGTADTAGAEVFHLASSEQLHGITKLLDFLRWGTEARANFIHKRFKRTAPAMLSQKQANALTMILLTIAAAREVKGRTGAARVSRKMIQAAIPSLKAQLGIDRKPAADDEDSK
jgi:hypothetical protein